MSGDGTKYGTGDAPVDGRGVPLLASMGEMYWQAWTELQAVSAERDRLRALVAVLEERCTIAEDDADRQAMVLAGWFLMGVEREVMDAHERALEARQ